MAFVSEWEKDSAFPLASSIFPAVVGKCGGLFSCPVVLVTTGPLTAVVIIPCIDRQCLRVWKELLGTRRNFRKWGSKKVKKHGISSMWCGHSLSRLLFPIKCWCCDVNSSVEAKVFSLSRAYVILSFEFVLCSIYGTWGLVLCRGKAPTYAYWDSNVVNDNFFQTEKTIRRKKQRVNWQKKLQKEVCIGAWLKTVGPMWCVRKKGFVQRKWEKTKTN